MHNYLRWTFHASFMAVTLTSFAQFMILIIFFAILIYWIDASQPPCLADNDEPPNFGDAYQLSWTTLSTVGKMFEFDVAQVQVKVSNPDFIGTSVPCPLL